jgi:D-amino-acid dehydrogenase
MADPLRKGDPMRVAIVGGGVIGLLAGHHLVKKGAAVTVIERGRLGAACSSGNAGWISPSISLPLPAPGLLSRSLKWMLRSDSPLYIKPSAVLRMWPFLLRFWAHCNQAEFERGGRAMAALGADTMELYDDLEADGVEFEWHGDGLLVVFRAAAELADEQRLLEQSGYGPYEVLTGDEVLAREPALAPHFIGGIHILPERAVRPEAVCAATAERLRESGAELIEDTAVDGLRMEGGRCRAARTAAGEIEADLFLVATGAEASALSTACGHPLPLQAGKGYSVTVTGPRTTIRHPLYLFTAKVGVTPFDGAIRVAGTMELSGINLHLDPKRLAALERAASADVPGVLEGETTTPWVGMRPITPDGLPILGRLGGTDNLFVATGHQMMGVTLAPATGKAMAELMLEGSASVDLEPFSPSRF